VVLDVTAERTEGAVVAQQPGHRRGVDQVVDRDDLDVVGQQAEPQVGATDPSKTVDADA